MPALICIAKKIEIEELVNIICGEFCDLINWVKFLGTDCVILRSSTDLSRTTWRKVHSGASMILIG